MRNYQYKFIIFFIIFNIFCNNIPADEAAPDEDMKYEIAKYSNKIFYEGNNDLVKKEIDLFSKKKINFKAQTTFNIPVKISLENNVIQKIEDILIDVKSFNEIPYYSKRTGKTTALFKDISILSDNVNEKGNRIIVANTTISPFKPCIMRFEIIKEKDFIMFKAYNIDKIKYWVLPIVDEQKMVILFAGELNKNIFSCYGLGVADTGSFFVFRKTVEEEFNSRSEAIINWFYSLFKIKLSGN
ncbi:MAG: hypothetical protein FWE72_01995 [Spirochaetaceae bacterium]|nr:hypothetical protein [Spirochaetaceae bacterium]